MSSKVITVDFPEEQAGAVIAALDAMVKNAPDDLPERAKLHFKVLDEAIANMGHAVLEADGGE